MAGMWCKIKKQKLLSFTVAGTKNSYKPFVFNALQTFKLF